MKADEVAGLTWQFSSTLKKIKLTQNSKEKCFVRNRCRILRINKQHFQH